MNSLLNKLSLALFISLMLPSFGQCADSGATKTEEKTPEKKPKAKSPYTPFRGEVASITDKQLTLKAAAGKEERKFTLNADTKITKDDKPATVADVKVGQQIGGSYIKGEDGTNTLHSLNLSVKQKDDKKGEAPKK